MIQIHNVGSPYQLAEKILGFFQSLEMKNGFFLEAGSSNGIWQSNSYYLEKILGWTGALVEPNRQMYEHCTENRKNPKNHFYNCALVSSSYALDFIEGYFNEQDFENIMMAQIDGVKQCAERSKRWDGKQPVSVAAKTLGSIMTAVGNKIDFLSLDVEGYELEVLDGSDIHIHRPKYVCIEAWPDEIVVGHEEKIKEYFLQRGYRVNQYLSERDILFEDYEKEKQ